MSGLFAFLERTPSYAMEPSLGKRLRAYVAFPRSHDLVISALRKGRKMGMMTSKDKGFSNTDNLRISACFRIISVRRKTTESHGCGMKVLEFNGGPWCTKAELARRMKVTKRTITNYVNSVPPTVVKATTPNGGVIFAKAEEAKDFPPPFPPEISGKESGKSNDNAAFNEGGKAESTAESSGNFRPTENAATEHLARSNADLARTNAKLVDQLAEARTELDQWRTRTEKAEHEAITWRSRYHVARGRVEMDDD